MRTYAEHLDAWEEVDRLGFDGIGFNEHHCSPYGLMNSPNLMAASAAQRTKRVKLLIYGNLLPLHEPLRLAEELAMLDCLSSGRLISGFARGIPREYQVHNVPLAESRARFEEAYDIITRAWTEEVFSYEGKFWSYKDVAIWPRPVQRPHPPVWIPIIGSKESIEFAAAHDIAITPGLRPGGLQEDIIRYYAKCLAARGTQVTPDHLSVGVNAYVADSKAQAVKENAPYFLYFNRTLFSHGNFTETSIGQAQGYMSKQSIDYVRPENLHEVERARADYRNMTLDDVSRMAERLPWGTPDEVAERIIAVASTRRRQHGAGDDERGRHAAGNVPRTDPPLCARGAAEAPGARGDARAGCGGGGGVEFGNNTLFRSSWPASVPAIHALERRPTETWMAVTSTAMTDGSVVK